MGGTGIGGCGGDQQGRRNPCSQNVHQDMEGGTSCHKEDTTKYFLNLVALLISHF